MRSLALILTLLLTAVTSAQTEDVTSGSPQGTQSLADPGSADVIDITPVFLDGKALGITVPAGFPALGFAALNLAAGGESCGQTAIGALGTVVVCGAMLYCLIAADARSAPLTLPSGTIYDADAVTAFASDTMTPQQRRSIARSARAAGREAVVLQRLVGTPAGVGTAPGSVVYLELSVLDAASGQFRALGEDVLMPTTVLSVRVESDLATAQAAALGRITDS